jgi:hypothetical protein
MAVEHHSEYQLLDDAVTAHNAHIRARWDREFHAWVSGDHSSPCPFQTLASKARELSCGDAPFIILTIFKGQ